ncbi:MAG TPA: hypothetical protein VGQ13_09605 [Nitrososphaera sp.]|nr:hypothetical protein [Nitrososphaera sp.]
MCVFSLIVNHTLFQTAAAPDVKVKTEIVASPTSVVPAIVDHGEKNRVDLIMTGTNGRSGSAAPRLVVT